MAMGSGRVAGSKGIARKDKDRHRMARVPLASGTSNQERERERMKGRGFAAAVGTKANIKPIPCGKSKASSRWQGHTSIPCVLETRLLTRLGQRSPAVLEAGAESTPEEKW